ncbi:MAG: hypothetical protein HKO66_03745 [Saprospiraceae bacterium]|nr:hypothetical protein [Saprospiraceae bacterium]
MKLLKLTFSLVLFIQIQVAFSQSDIEIGQWASYLPHNQASWVTLSDEKIIYATNEAIFTIDKEEMSIEFLSKIDGLTETGISEIIYDNFNDQLIIAYENSTIDLVQGNNVFPVFDIKNNTNFIDRKINKLFVQNEEWLYMATGFGLIQYNLQGNDFGFTLDAGQLVSDVSGNEKYLTIVGDNGVFILDYENAQFPNAFSTWDKAVTGLPVDYKAKAVLVLDNQMYIATDTEVYVSDDFETFNLVYQNTNPSFKTIFLKATDGDWILGQKDNSSKSRLLFFDNFGSLINEVNTCTNRLLDVTIDERGRIFFADEWKSIRYLDENGSCQKESFKGPFNIDATDIDIKDDRVYVASGGVTENLFDDFGREGVYLLNEGSWNNINQDNNAFFKDNDIIQFYQIETHPSQEKFYIGSFWAGLVEYDETTGDQILYTADNTQGALQTAVGDDLRTRISGLAFDNNENLWVASYLASRPLAVFSSEGTWHSFDIDGETRLTDIVVDDLGFVWGVIGGNTGGVTVYDSGASVQDPTDDRSKFFNINNSEIPSNIVNAIAKDLDGTIWVGTAQGVVAFECGGSVFESVCTGNKRQVQQDSIGAFLLETEDVQAIAIDGANRKWFGTRNGIFVQSPSGEDQVAKYDVDNSKLFDNNIKAMAYNDKTGEMFIASNRGLQAFRTPTTGARVSHSSNVYAFPNPVRPEHVGDIAIKGLARDAEVKITDIDGQLVFQTEALGGQAIWNGKDISGRDVVGGVYLVFSSSSDSFRDPDSFVTKILVVR